MIARILVPVDGSVHANAAVDWAADLAAKYRAGITLLHVMVKAGSGTVPEELREFARYEKITVTDRDIFEAVAEKILYAAEQRARAHGASTIETVFETGDPAAVIANFAKRLGADLIVMGRRGLGSLPGILVGSVSHKVLHLADCACLTVK